MAGTANRLGRLSAPSLEELDFLAALLDPWQSSFSSEPFLLSHARSRPSRRIFISTFDFSQ